MRSARGCLLSGWLPWVVCSDAWAGVIWVRWSVTWAIWLGGALLGLFGRSLSGVVCCLGVACLACLDGSGLLGCPRKLEDARVLIQAAICLSSESGVNGAR